MTKTKIIVLVSFAVVFAAGLAVGLLVERSARPHRRRPWRASGLDLTPEQREQMGEIWSQSEQRSPMRQYFERRRAIREWRDEAVQALLTEEQKARHVELMQEYERKLAELNEERRKAFEERMERTKQILTEQQRKKYEEFLEGYEEFREGRGPGGTPLSGVRGRPEGGPPHRRGGRPGSGPFREDRNAPGGDVHDSPRGQE